MTAVLAQPSMLSANNLQRQDIVSALLDDYADPFRDQGSPYAASPAVSAYKELPPPPPQSSEKPYPPGLMRGFQLRVNEPASPAGSDGSRKDSLDSPSRIVSQSLSRSSRPPSLKLRMSNGSTATLPAVSSVPSNSTPVVPAVPSKERALPDLPPPPPEKSQRRTGMGHHSSVASAASQEQRELNPPIIKRKAVPTPGTGKYPSLADLGRGRKLTPRPATAVTDSTNPIEVSPAPATVQPSNGSAGAFMTETSREAARPPTPPQKIMSSQERSFPPRGASLANQQRLQSPPTPEDSPSSSPPFQPQPVRRVPTGLPSGPKSSKQGELDVPPLPKLVPTPNSAKSPKHSRGKSSTGFDIFKRPEKSTNNNNNNNKKLETMTPSPTPSPTQSPEIKPQDPEIADDLPVAPPLPADEQREPKPIDSPLSPPTVLREAQGEPAGAATPVSVMSFDSVESPPLSALPPRPKVSNIPKLTNTHYNCYHSHARFHRSSNRFVPTPCALCKHDDGKDKWSCTWCYLRICTGCRQQLERFPARSVQKFLERKKFDSGTGSMTSEERAEAKGGPDVVVWEAEERSDEEGGEVAS